MNGWAMSPVHKSEIANPFRRIWNGVLTNVLLQIAAKKNAFPITATGEEIAINKAVQKVAAFEYDAFVQLSAAELQGKKNVCCWEEPLLDIFCLWSPLSLISYDGLTSVKMNKFYHRHGNEHKFSSDKLMDWKQGILTFPPDKTE